MAENLALLCDIYIYIVECESDLVRNKTKKGVSVSFCATIK